jgi:hypothetical protein
VTKTGLYWLPGANPGGTTIGSAMARDAKPAMRSTSRPRVLDETASGYSLISLPPPAAVETVLFLAGPLPVRARRRMRPNRGMPRSQKLPGSGDGESGTEGGGFRVGTVRMSEVFGAAPIGREGGSAAAGFQPAESVDGVYYAESHFVQRAERALTSFSVVVRAGPY